VQHGDVLVAEVAEQPPEPGGTARGAVVVRDDEDARADPGPSGHSGEGVRTRQRMPAPTLRAQIGQLVDPEERRSRDVLLQICLPPSVGAIERVAAVDELVPDQ
jgi:hypothetical protein